MYQKELICANLIWSDLIAGVLDELGRLDGRKPFDTNAVKIFDEVISSRQRGIVSYSGYGAYDSIGNGRGKIGMPNPPPSNNTVLVNSYIRGLVHELIHVAPGSHGPLYTHQQMAQAAYNVATAQGYKGIGKQPDKNNTDYQNSVYFESRQFDACGPNVKR